MMRYPFFLVLLQFGSVILGLLRFLKVLVLGKNVLEVCLFIIIPQG